MQLGPAGSPRPDVYAMEPTYTRMTFEAFECKVTVTDFRRDITSGKWQKYLRYANAVTFAVPAGLVTKEQVPAQCGLIVRGVSGQWRYAKKPTRQVLTELPWQAWIKLLLDGAERIGMSTRVNHWNAWRAERALAKKFGDETAARLAQLERLPQLYDYEVQLHEDRVKRLRQVLDRETEESAQRRAQAESRCSETTGRLAVALGLAPDALLQDLQGRAQQVLRLLEAGAGRLHPFARLADQMERMAEELRGAEAALAGAGGERSCAVE